MLNYNRELFNQHLKALQNLPPVYIEIEDVELEREVNIPNNYKTFRDSPIHFMPPLLYNNEIFVVLTHSELTPNIIPNRYYISNY